MSTANNAMLGAMGALLAGAITAIATLNDVQELSCRNLNLFCPAEKASPTGAADAERPTKPAASGGAQHAAAPAPAAAPSRPLLPGEEEAWRQARALASAGGYQNFLEQFPNGHYANEAQDRLDEANRVQAAAYSQPASTTAIVPAAATAGPNPAEIAAMCQQWAEQAYPESSTASFAQNAMGGCVAGSSCDSGQEANNRARERRMAIQSCIAAGGRR